jgi:hypothetical protein
MPMTPKTEDGQIAPSFDMHFKIQNQEPGLAHKIRIDY